MLRIDYLYVSSRVEEKINSLHGVSILDVEDALEAPIVGTWIEDGERGRRLMVRGVTRTGRVLRVVLYPRPISPENAWNLATAFY